MSSSSSRDTRVYVGNLPPDIRTRDVEDLFYKYGDITYIDLKTRRGPPFAFVEFSDPRDAKDAVFSRDGFDYDGYRLRVEFPRGRERGPGGHYKGNRDSGSRRGQPTRRSNYRVKVTGLPPTGSWQDLKDHMREAGDVCYADVYKNGTGVVEFLRSEDMKYAIRKLDDSRFRSHEGEVSYVRVQEDTGDGGYSRSRSRSRSKSRSPTPIKCSRSSPTYSPARDSRSRSRSRSSRPVHSKRSRSPSFTNNHKSLSRSTSRSTGGSHSRSPSRSQSSRSISRD
ncbi:hypothetical protein RDWZM_009582 [Blomia tropicalis]|uniref:RRM domain-containing protein n=1 Tax=Blomia tropicalis TaxID=40697 RepID=A0A9Q0RLG0_BLOTA|nr:Serine/arginine-rich splicing factor 1 [Blomia tropicalis]KAJ6218421.1 hypothetical protein RDWZM_009578 [Blomia tropicalis]KAJ6218425.1 hypothetical protein RDWZM_009582 [Blomia tropicalis]